MKKIIIYVTLICSCYSLYCQDTMRMSDTDIDKPFHPHDSLISEIQYILKEDKIFIITHYPYRVSYYYEILDSMVCDSGRKFIAKNSDSTYSVFYFRKTAKINQHINGIICRPRKVITYKNGKKKSCRVYFLGGCINRYY